MSLLNMIFGSVDSDKVKVLPAQEYQQTLKEKKGKIVDVRTPQEFASGHIKGAKNIDHYSNDFVERFSGFNKEDALFIYCRSGARSRAAASKLVKAGFNEIYDLQGGFMRWSR